MTIPTPFENTLRKLPKVELHAHLNGTIRESTLTELASERGVKLNEKYHFFNQQDNCNNKNTSNTTKSTDDDDAREKQRQQKQPKRSLSECFEIFSEIAKCVDDLHALERVTREALVDFASHNVVYLELRSTPKRLYRFSPLKKQQSQQSSSSGLGTKREYCETVLNVMKEFQSSHVDLTGKSCMTCRFIVAIDRAQPVADGMEHVDLAIQLREDYDFKDLVVGIDLGGNPLKRDFTDFRKCFEKARANNLKVTLHCGEVPCDEKLGGTSSREYQDAECILAFKPDRLGHALLLPPSLQEQLLQLQIPVETCPTSNVMTLELNDTTHSSSTESVVEGLRRHPQLSAWLFGEDTSNEVSCVVENKFPSHPISICTDDSGVFNTDATQELALLVAAFQTRGVGIQELKDLIFQSVDFAFCDDQTKKEVKGRLVQGTCQ